MSKLKLISITSVIIIMFAVLDGVISEAIGITYENSNFLSIVGYKVFIGLWGVVLFYMGSKFKDVEQG
jgi:hypothetical protein